MEKKYLIQDITVVAADDLLAIVADLHAAGYRVCQACATTIDTGFELLYTFDRDQVLKNLKVIINDGDEVQSISGIYWPAFVFENEMHDLFGIKFKNLALDYDGGFYKLALPTPWNPRKQQEAAAAAATASAVPATAEDER